MPFAAYGVLDHMPMLVGLSGPQTKCWMHWLGSSAYPPVTLDTYHIRPFPDGGKLLNHMRELQNDSYKSGDLQTHMKQNCQFLSNGMTQPNGWSPMLASHPHVAHSPYKILTLVAPTPARI